MTKIKLQQDERAWRITLADPPLHILDIGMLTELRDALHEVRDDRTFLIIAAEGEKAFSAGASVQDHMGERIGPMLSAFHDCFRILNRLELVTVALVKGVALGGGCELALACDLVIASDRAKFGQPEINLGVFPPVAAYQLSHLLPRRIGLEMFLTGDPIGAADAASLGLVNAIVPFDTFDQGAEDWLGKISRHSSSSIRLAKRAFRMAAASDFEEKLAAVERLYLEELMKTEDAEEGLRAFLEKRKPNWTGR